MKNFAVVFYETSQVIDVFNTRSEAVQALREFEETDMDEGIYQPGLYDIKEM